MISCHGGGHASLTQSRPALAASLKRSTDILKYPAHHYDENLVLKVPAMLWLVILYGIRHFLFVGFAKLMPMDIVTIPWINFQTSPFFMLTDLPAAIVLFAIGHRVPNGQNFMRGSGNPAAGC